VRREISKKQKNWQKVCLPGITVSDDILHNPYAPSYYPVILGTYCYQPLELRFDIPLMPWSSPPVRSSW
jgi:hypothetical protein